MLTFIELSQGSHFFPLTKFPDFSSIFLIFPWLLLNIFMVFISLLVLWLLFFQWPRIKNIYFTQSKNTLMKLK